MLKRNINPTINPTTGSIKINDNVQFNTNKFSNIPITIKDPPAYGNLKGGTNPTYRVWKKTLKNRNNITNSTNSSSNPTNSLLINSSLSIKFYSKF